MSTAPRCAKQASCWRHLAGRPLVEAVEVPGKRFYVGVQYHPEFKSRPNRAHPLFRAFVADALRYQDEDK